MVTYEEAKKIAQELKKNIDRCYEHTDAYVFTNEAEEMSFGGDSPCVVLKEDGRAINMTEYTDNHKYELIREYKI